MSSRRKEAEQEEEQRRKETFKWVGKMYCIFIEGTCCNGTLCVAITTGHLGDVKSKGLCTQDFIGYNLHNSGNV